MLDRAIASRWRAWADRRDRRRFRARLAFWELERTTRVRAISGAVMAIRASAFDDAGGFDERFRLYFEENDFFRRVPGEIAYVPAARCRHLYNQSAAGSAEAAALYARSEAAYLRKWGGAAAKRFDIAPRESLFIDDFRANIVAARALGWNAVHFLSHTQCETELATGGWL